MNLIYQIMIFLFKLLLAKKSIRTFILAFIEEHQDTSQRHLTNTGVHTQKQTHSLPVSIELRLGQHMGVETYPQSKETPSLRRYRFSLGMNCNDPSSTSQKKNTSTIKTSRARDIGQTMISASQREGTWLTRPEPRPQIEGTLS